MRKNFKGDNREIIQFYLDNFVGNEYMSDYVKNKKISLKLKDKYNSNIIFNFVFLVNTLDDLLDSIKDLNVNGGPQSDRAKCSLLDSSLSTLDQSIRNSMFTHSIKYQAGLTSKDFSFKNIHMNLGKVR